MYIEKLISFTHKLVLAAAHWPGLCWQFQRGFLDPWKPYPAVLTSIQLAYFQCVRCSWVVCECVMLLVFFCIFLCKSMCSTAHRYYSAGAGHSVALAHPQKLIRKETHLLTKTYVIQNIFNVVYREKRYKKIWMVKFSMICLSTGVWWC